VPIRRYHDLACYQLSNDLKLRVYAFTGKGPASRDIKFCDQCRASARSAPANIAEGFGRFQPADFARFLLIARASLIETQSHVNDGFDLGYVTDSERIELLALANRAIGAVTNLALYLKRQPKRS
jgi:four helix bundle protein